MPYLRDAALGLRLRSLAGDDIPDLAEIHDGHQQRRAVVVGVGNDVGYTLRRRLVFQVGHDRPRVEDESPRLLRHQSSRSRFFSAISALSNPLPRNLPRKLWTYSRVIGFRII